jgi:hypothetical protein
MRNSITIAVCLAGMAYLLSGATALSAQSRDADEIVLPVSREIEETMTYDRTRITFSRELTEDVELHRTVFEPGTKLSFARFGELAFALVDHDQTLATEAAILPEVQITIPRGALLVYWHHFHGTVPANRPFPYEIHLTEAGEFVGEDWPAGTTIWFSYSWTRESGIYEVSYLRAELPDSVAESRTFFGAPPSDGNVRFTLEGDLYEE